MRQIGRYYGWNTYINIYGFINGLLRQGKILNFYLPMSEVVILYASSQNFNSLIGYDNNLDEYSMEQSKQ